jgi:hypothetical protein
VTDADAVYAVQFWVRIDKSAGPKGCWPCIGATINGYGAIHHNGFNLAHRFAFFLNKGKIPAGKCVLHKCDNPPCCNPRHLFLGSNADNVKDSMAKGRHINPVIAKKLTLVKVYKIRKLYAGGSMAGDLAKQFGVSRQSIWLTVNKKRWA